MDNCTHNFKNTLTSSSHGNFRLDVFQSKRRMINFVNVSTENHLLSLFIRVKIESHLPLKSPINYFH